MNFSVINLGCKVNKVESDEVVARLAVSGTETAPEHADLIVVNTCTVTGEAEKKTRKAVRRALRANDYARVIVTGCAIAIDPDFYEQLDERIRVVTKQQLSLALDAYTENEDCSATLRVGLGFRTRVGVKIQDGCNHACTYCIVHVARGRATSRPASEVLDECVSLMHAGVNEIVLTGINIGSYRDRSGYLSSEHIYESSSSRAEPLNLAQLLTLLLKATYQESRTADQQVRFRISSIEPRDVTDELIEVMRAANGRVCRHLHLPLQSGSTEVLRAMARPYSSDYFCRLVERIYSSIPSMSISTDIIVGFPGETVNQFEETMAVARTCRFSKLHVFPYSQRSGTIAAARPDQVAPQEKARRCSQLRELGDKLRESEFERRRGTVEIGLVEEHGICMTESYFELPAPIDAEVGSLVSVSFSQASGESPGKKW